jgi:hypothetical protein
MRDAGPSDIQLASEAGAVIQEYLGRLGHPVNAAKFFPLRSTERQIHSTLFTADSHCSHTLVLRS